MFALRFKLRTRLITAFLLVALIPIFLLEIINIQQTRRALTHSAETTLRSDAAQSAAGLEAFLQNNLDSLRSEAQIPDLQRMMLRRAAGADVDINLVRDAQVVLRGLANKDALNIISYAMLDQNGINVADTYPLYLGQDESTTSAFKLARDGNRASMTPVEFQDASDEPMITFSSPIRTDNGRFLGVLRVRYKAAVLQQQIVRSTQQVGGQAFGMLFDEYGLRLADGANPELRFTLVDQLNQIEQSTLTAQDRLPVMQPRVLNLPQLAAGLSSAVQDDAFVAVTRADSQRQDQVAAIKLETQPWTLAFAMPRSAFLGPIRTQTLTTILFALVIAALVLIAAWFFARRLLRPLGQLNSAATQLEQGDLSARASVINSDEIGQLAHTFNTMAEQLQQTVSSLEERVAERTSALQTALDQQAQQAQQLQQALATQQQLNEQIASLAMPAIPVRHDTVVVPLVGVIDLDQLHAGATRVLQMISQQRIRHVVLDVTGVAVIDPATAQAVVTIGRTLRLLGADMTLVGVRPEMAQTLVTMLDDLSDLPTYATLQQALRRT